MNTYTMTDTARGEERLEGVEKWEGGGVGVTVIRHVKVILSAQGPFLAVELVAISTS